ncbi:polysaccharide biosynthesis/export family protein [Nitrospira sp. Nam80]
MSSLSIIKMFTFVLAAVSAGMLTLPGLLYSADPPLFPQPPHIIDKPVEMNGKEAPNAGPALPTVGPALPAISHTQTIEKLSNIVSDAYTIGAEDVLEITVWRNQDLSKTVQVRPDGRFSLPVIRDVLAVGKTPSQLADEITRKLREYVQNPVVAISVKEVNSYSIFVLGEVVKPGKYPLKSRTTLLQGITIAGGFTPVAARNQVVVFRFGENGTLTSSYDDIVLRGVIAQNLELKAGDTVVVPSEAMVVFPGVQ